MISSGQADRLNERELLPDFLSDLFVHLLGYVSPPGHQGRYTLSREQHVEVDGQFADAALGCFGGPMADFVIVVEGKGPRDPLDRAHAGRRMSAIDQGYRYAINLPCDWIIITNIRQTRLYYKGADQHTYEQFDTVRLATDDGLLRKLVYLLHADLVLPATGQCHLYGLLEESERVGRDLTRRYYRTYANLREQTFQQLCAANETVAPQQVLTSTQKLLDRILFCAFCEDRGLLPDDSIRQAFEHRDPYNPRPIWDNFRGLFRAVDEGREALRIPRYNGGLFAIDGLLDQRLVVPDGVCSSLAELGEFEYRSAAEVAQSPQDAPEAHRALVDVDILGHIFEQSISDLERLRGQLDGQLAEPAVKKTKSRRNREGAFYTPSFITRYIIEQALGSVLRDRFEALRRRHRELTEQRDREKNHNPRTVPVLEDPNTYDASKLSAPQRQALIDFWFAWQRELGSVRLLDPACGSGAFLVEAFDQLYAVYTRANERLAELRGQPELFDLDKQILQNNLYGVDLNDEAIEICRLSLWIKTAQRGKVLTALDHTIRAGNSVVTDPAVHERAFDWQTAFPEVVATGGFDVVVGNPPYVRQEMLAEIKAHLEQNFASYHGMADLYVYFYELGLRVLKPGGRLSLVVTNKWLKAGYAEPLRRHLAQQSWVESLVDFGHAKQIFEDADVFPCILVAQKPAPATTPPTPRIAVIPREQLRIEDLSRQITDSGYAVDAQRFRQDAWQLDNDRVGILMEKLRGAGTTLSEYLPVQPFYGIKTGMNEAFLVDSVEKDSLVRADSACAAVLKPYVRGQDVKRWSLDWDGQWMIAMKSSVDHRWPWSDQTDNAEEVFRQSYPSLHARLKQREHALRKRTDQGVFWWELRKCASWDELSKPKIFTQQIQFYGLYAYDDVGMVGNNKTVSIQVDDKYLLAVLNSPVLWWFAFRHLPHMKDEALAPVGDQFDTLPIPRPREDQRSAAESAVRRLIELTKQRQAATRAVVDWLRVEFDVAKPTLKLQSPTQLDTDAFVAEVKKARGRKSPLSVAGLKALRDEHAATLVPVRGQKAEARDLERRLSDLVNAAYGMTPDEIDLMWETAPPRMPLSK